MDQPLIRAAQYVRMSTDQQEHSIDNQIDAISEFARAHGIEVVRTYSDPGRSGLTLEDRPGLQRLLNDVRLGDFDWSALLIYDVSRWGRFQDPDEAAAYEFLVRSAGIQVIYCVEQFNTAGGAVDALLKHMKRSMAAEYSRDLSLRISRAQARWARNGFWVVGRAPFGYQRWAIAPDGRKMLLRSGELCHAQGWRTKLEPGPPAAVKAVRRLYQLYVDEDRSVRQTTIALAAEGHRWSDGTRIGARRIHSVIEAGLAAGDLHYRRRHRPLGSRAWVDAPADQQVHVLGAFKAIVPRTKVKAAIDKAERVRPAQLSDEELINRLTTLLRVHGRLSTTLVMKDPELPCPSVLAGRFGSCNTAFQMAGFTPLPPRSFTQARGERTRTVRVECCGLIRLALEERGLPTLSGGPSGFYLGQRKIAVLTATPYSRGPKPWSNGKYWFGLNPVTPADLAVVCRVDGDPYEPVDFRVASPPQQGGRFYLRVRRHPPDRWGPVLASIDDVATALSTLV